MSDLKVDGIIASTGTNTALTLQGKGSGKVAIGDDQKRGPETVEVVGQAVTVTRTAIDKTEEDILNDWKEAMFDTDRDVTRATEDIYDALQEDAQARVVQVMRDRITAKKTLRGQKP